MTEQVNEELAIPLLANEEVNAVNIPIKAEQKLVLCRNCDGGHYVRTKKHKVLVGNTPDDPVHIPHECNSCGDEVYLEATWLDINWKYSNHDAARSQLRDEFGHSGVISLIWARTHNYGIGHKGELPWGRDYPTDLKWFSKVTKHNPDALLVVGKNTFETLPTLPDRKMAILTSEVSEKTECAECDGHYYPDIPTLLADQPDTDLIVIGGGYSYGQWFRLADVVYETIIYGNYPVDTFSPMLNADNFTNLDTHCIKDCDDKGKPVVFNIWLSNRAKGSLEEHIIRDRWNFKIEDKLNEA